MSSRPTPTDAVATGAGSRASRPTARARAAPTASSQARAGSRKNASGASLDHNAVSRIRQADLEPLDPFERFQEVGVCL